MTLGINQSHQWLVLLLYPFLKRNGERDGQVNYSHFAKSSISFGTFWNMSYPQADPASAASCRRKSDHNKYFQIAGYGATEHSISPNTA